MPAKYKSFRPGVKCIKLLRKCLELTFPGQDPDRQMMLWILLPLTVVLAQSAEAGHAAEHREREPEHGRGTERAVGVDHRESRCSIPPREFL